jgi:hypothetical protein
MLKAAWLQYRLTRREVRGDLSRKRGEVKKN